MKTLQSEEDDVILRNHSRVVNPAFLATRARRAHARAHPSIHFSLSASDLFHEKFFTASGVRTADLPVAGPTLYPFDHGDPLDANFI